MSRFIITVDSTVEPPLGPAIFALLESKKCYVGSLILVWKCLEYRGSRSMQCTSFCNCNYYYASLRIPCDVLTKFCDKLQTNGCLQTLSLNYCKLDHTCGEVLGGYIAVSQIR